MDFHDLHAFYHVANEGGFSKASARLRVAQSALSRRVARLERTLGIPLLKRHGRGVQLTGQGILLVDRAKNLMEELDRIERDILVLAEEPIGRVRVAMPPTISQVLGPQLVTECMARFPRIQLELSEAFSDTVQGWVADEAVDVGLGFNAGHETNLQLSLLLDEPLVLLVPPNAPGVVGFGSDGPVDIRILGEVALVVPRRPNMLRMILDRLATQQGFALNVAWEVDGVSALKGFVRAGLGYSVFSANGLEGSADRRDLGCRGFIQPVSWQLALIGRRQIRAPRAYHEVEQILKALIARQLDEGLWQGSKLSGLK